MRLLALLLLCLPACAVGPGPVAGGGATSGSCAVRAAALGLGAGQRVAAAARREWRAGDSVDELMLGAPPAPTSPLLAPARRRSQPWASHRSACVRSLGRPGCGPARADRCVRPPPLPFQYSSMPTHPGFAGTPADSWGLTRWTPEYLAALAGSLVMPARVSSKQDFLYYVSDHGKFPGWAPTHATEMTPLGRFLERVDAAAQPLMKPKKRRGAKPSRASEYLQFSRCGPPFRRARQPLAGVGGLNPSSTPALICLHHPSCFVFSSVFSFFSSLVAVHPTDALPSAPLQLGLHPSDGGHAARRPPFARAAHRARDF